MTKISAIQMCSSNNLDENLLTAGKFIEEAAHHGAKLTVLPEMFAFMGKSSQDKLAFKETFHQGKIQRFLSDAAKKNKIWIVGGTIPLTCDANNKVRAACLVFNDQGLVVARYDKIHLFDVELSAQETYLESETTEPGTQITTVNTPFGKIGLGVCYDIRFPELFRNLLEAGTEIIIVPSAFTKKTGNAHWEVLSRSTAIQNFCYFLGACQGGKHNINRQTYGHSIIVDPWGTMLAQKPDDTPGIIYADIDLEKLHQIRKSIPILKHARRGETN